MDILFCIGAVAISVLAIAAAIYWAPKSLTDNPVHPECMMCDNESCIGCPVIEAKVGKMY